MARHRTGNRDNRRSGTAIGAVGRAALVACAFGVSAAGAQTTQVIQTPFGPLETPVPDSAPVATPALPAGAPRPSGPAPQLVVPVPARVGSDNRVQVDVVDGLISMTAEAVSLSELLATLDRAYGTESSVAPHLGNRNISVRFDGLEFGQAVRKIFEGQSLDYLVVGENRIMVTAESGVAPPGGAKVTRTAPGSATPAAQQRAPVILSPAANGVNNPFQVQPSRQPVPQPFGQLFGVQGNPTAGQPGIPIAVPGGAPQQPPNSLFGNTNPTILDLNNPQQSLPASPTAPQIQRQQGPFPAFPAPAEP